MKNSKRNNKKGKFVDLEEFNSKSKINDDLSSTDLFQETNFKNIKYHYEYETPLQTLVKLFPHFSKDIIEAIFEENDRAFNKTKKILEQLSGNNQYESYSKIKETNNSTITHPEEEANVQYIDINSLAKFKFDEDPFIENLPKTNQTKNLSEFKKKKVDVNKLIVNDAFTCHKKDSGDYISVFSSLNGLANEHTPKGTNSKLLADDFYLESLTLDFYCDTLIEFFPNLTRIEIMQKICDYDFDIDKIIISLFEGADSNADYTKMEALDISKDFKHEVLSNFYSRDVVVNMNSDLNHFNNTIFNHNIQDEIEKEIIKKNLTSKLCSGYTEKDFPFLSEDVKNEYKKQNTISDEYFIDKDIKDIKTKLIREDLQRLRRNFISTDETVLKWVYYQYMDYNETYKYLKKNAKHKGIFDKYQKFDVIDKDSIALPINNNVENSSVPLENINNSIFIKIISENPNKWSFEADYKNINLDDYQDIRRQLLKQARIAWRNNRPQDAKIIMAKARRYKQDINTLLVNKKIKLFSKNNEGIEKLFNYYENCIDLHGLNLEESKMVLNKKLSQIKSAKSRGDLEPGKKFVFNIITGVGHHSVNHISTLMPKLQDYLRSMNLPMKTDRDKGILTVFL